MPSADSDDAPLLATVPQFAAIAQLNPKTVYAMIAKGELPGVRRFGRAVRIVVAEAIGTPPPGVVSSVEAAGLLKDRT